MNQSDVDFESQVLVEFYKRLLNSLGIKIMEMFFFSNIMGKGAVSGKPDYLDQAYKIGTNLVKYNEIRD